jgi:hypothetical protein
VRNEEEYSYCDFCSYSNLLRSFCDFVSERGRIPGVDAVAIINNSKISYWPAKDYQGNGTYDLVIGFHRDVIPKEGDMVKVVVKVVDVRGRTLATDKNVILWD